MATALFRSPLRRAQAYTAKPNGMNPRMLTNKSFQKERLYSWSLQGGTNTLFAGARNTAGMERSWRGSAPPRQTAPLPSEKS